MRRKRRHQSPMAMPVEKNGVQPSCRVTLDVSFRHRMNGPRADKGMEVATFIARDGRKTGAVALLEFCYEKRRINLSC